MGSKKKALTAAVSPAAGLLSGAKGLLGGGAPGAPADPIAAELKQGLLNSSRAQQLGLSQLTSLANEDVTGLARLRASKEITGLQSGVEDVRRKQEGLLARRGLGATSLGTGALAGAQQQATQRAAAIRASIPERVALLRQQRAQALLGGATQAVGSQNVPIRFNQGPRQKSLFSQLLPAFGAGIGGALGGGVGAGVGAQAGSSISGRVS